MISAHIPEKITYVCKESQSITPVFGDTSDEFFKTSAMPAFPVDPSKPNTLDTARRWAAGYHNDTVYKEIEMDNTPISEVQIVDLEYRDQGGRAYKAIVHGSYLVDFREDVMLETMLVKGVRQGVFIASSFIWVKIGSQMKLVRVGSSLHKAAVEAHTVKQEKKVSTKDLKPGTIYQNVNGDHMFLGFVKTANLNYEIETNGSRCSSSYHRHYVLANKTKPYKAQLWLSIYESDIKEEERTMPDYLKNVTAGDNYWRFELTKSKTVYPTKHPVFEVPDDIVENIRNMYIRRADNNTSKKTSGAYYMCLEFSERVMNNYPDDIILSDELKNAWNSVDFK